MQGTSTKLVGIQLTFGWGWAGGTEISPSTNLCGQCCRTGNLFCLSYNQEFVFSTGLNVLLFSRRGTGKDVNK